jgi:ABC-type spermidine/putrescine transport system permease subunit II
MESALETLHEATNNAYILFSFALGVWAAFIGAQNVPISGNFWGAMWTNTILAGLVLGVAIILFVLGIEAKRGVYYLYGIYFVISLPGVFTIMKGNDNRRAAIFFAIVALFNSAAAYRAGTELVKPWG